MNANFYRVVGLCVFLEGGEHRGLHGFWLCGSPDSIRSYMESSALI